MEASELCFIFDLYFFEFVSVFLFSNSILIQ